MSKTKKTPVYTTKTKESEKYSSGKSSFVRLMSLFLAGLMVLGAVAAAIFAFLGIGHTAHPLPAEYGITEISDLSGDTVC